MYVLGICKILGLFVNTLNPDEKYSLLNRENLTQPIQMQLSTKEKNFLGFFLQFGNLDQILNILKKITLKAFAFAKVRTAKDIHKKSRL